MRRVRTTEAGIALFAAIVIGVLVLGAVTAFSSLIMGQLDENRRSQQRTEATYWVQSAGEQIAGELQTMRVGRSGYVGLDPTRRYEIWRLPTSAERGWDGRASAFRVALTSAAAAPRGGAATGPAVGWYQLRPPVPGAPAGTVAYAVDPADIDNRGTLIAVMRGWSNGNAARPQDVRVTWRRGSISRFSMLSDHVLDLATVGSTSITGAIHANNAEDAGNAIVLAGSAASTATSVTTTSGDIVGPCPAGRCRADVEQRIPLESADASFNLVQERGTNCRAGVLCWWEPTTAMSWAPAGRAPAWRVNIAGTGCVQVGRVSVMLRRDAGAVASVDDRIAPAGAGGAGQFCPAVGGGALLFNGDVVVTGTRGTGARPLTILARRGANPPVVNVNGISARLTTPASAWLDRTAGSDTDRAPLGIVAEGSAYVPSWSLADMRVRNVAIMTKLGQLAIGPASLAVAGAPDGVLAGGGNVAAGGGIDPCAAGAEGYASARSFTLTGSIASRRQPVLQYGSTRCWIGYGSRSYTYVDRLGWDPPPAFPVDEPWHMSKWTQGGT